MSNLILKKREHVMTLANPSVPLSSKTDIIFSPISKCQLLPIEDVQNVTTQFRQRTETSALVAVAMASKSSSSKTFRTSEFSKYAGSPLQDRRYRGGRLRGGKSSKKFYLRNREYFNRRDRYSKGRGQGKKSQPSTSQSQ